MGESFTETDLEDGAMQLLSGSGVTVVVIPDKSLNQETFERARDILRQKAPHPLEVRAIALRQDYAGYPEFIMRQAEEGFAIVRDHGESPLARARNYMQRVLKLRTDALTHLGRTMGASTPPPPMPAHLRRIRAPR